MRKKWTPVLATALLASSLAGLASHGAAPATPQGLITGKAFNSITGTALSAVTNHAKFPTNPDAMYFLPYFEWNASGDIATPAVNLADNYGGQIVGYFYPPSTGDYIFYLAADDNAVLYLSTDANSTNKKVIARETTWSNPREYTFSGGNSDLTAKDTSQYLASEWPTKDPGTGAAKITLQANQPYYIEAIFKEGTGGDNLSVAVLDPNFTIDAASPIPGQYLSSDRANGAATITTQPLSQTIPERGSVTFRVLADGTPPYTYQWRRNGTDILDATNINFTLPGVAASDSTARFSVVVTGAQGSATSGDAILTVAPDMTLPTIVSAKGSPNRTEVVVTFSEPVDQASGSALANYQISTSAGPLNITAATLSPSGTQVSLTTAPQTLGTKYTLLVSNVKDSAATPNTIVANSKAVFIPTGKLIEINGMIVIEAENYDRNTDDIWVRNTIRGLPSAGASVVAPNGAGGNENSKLEYDVEFAQAGIYQVWIRASGDNGSDDSVWFFLDGDGDGVTERPLERIDGNQASMTGFQPQTDFVWRSDAQDPPDPFTVEIPAAGPRAIALSRREDGSFVDKIILTTDSAFTPTGFGPPETREGAPGLPTVSITSPTAGQTFAGGANINLAANTAGQSGLEITRVQYLANGSVVGQSTTSPYNFTWTNVSSGIYGIQALAFDEIGQSTLSAAVNVEVATTTGANIGWVSFHPRDTTPSTAAATAGFTNAADKGYTDLLKSSGHTITRILTSGNPNTNLLNQFDLVIVSRSVPSGDYELAEETARWNGITAPLMMLGGYASRASRLGLFTGSTIPDTTSETLKLNINDTNHPIFAGISVDANKTMVNDYANLVSFGATVQRGISLVTEPPVDGATILATVATDTDPTFGNTVIAEIPAGTATANARLDVLAGKRLLFLTGSRENDGLTSEGAGIFDLTAEGAKMFVNAVNYMAGVDPDPVPDRPTVSVSRAANGTITINFTGTLQSSSSLQGAWADETATSPLQVTPNQPMKFYRSKR